MFETIDFRQLSDLLKSGNIEVYRYVWIEGCKIIIPLLVKRGIPRDRAEQFWTDCWLKIFQSRCESYDPERGAFSSWLIAVALNFAFDEIRKGRHYEEVPIEEAHAISYGYIPSEEKPSGKQELENLVKEAKKSLSKIDRAIIAKRFEQGLPADRIAHELGIPKSAIRMRISRAKQRLRKAFERLIPDELRRPNRKTAEPDSS